MGLEKFCAVEHEGYGAVVFAEDVHAGGEDAGLDGYALLADQLDDVFVELCGVIGQGGGIEAGSASFAAIAVEGELTDEQDLPGGIGDAEIHFVVFVGENAEVYQFFSYELGVGLGIVLSHAEINQQARGDLPDDFFINLNPSVFNPLYHCAHNLFPVPGGIEFGSSLGDFRYPFPQWCRSEDFDLVAVA